jgi:hypothetical protein
METIIHATKFITLVYGNAPRTSDNNLFILTPIESAEALVKHGVTDPDILCAAILRHIFRTKDCTAQLLYDHGFSRATVEILLELKENAGEHKMVQRKMEIAKAETRSYGAAMVLIADSYSHILQMRDNPIPKWTLKQKVGFFVWKRRLLEFLPNEVKNHPLYTKLLGIINAYVCENRINGREVTIDDYYKGLAIG